MGNYIVFELCLIFSKFNNEECENLKGKPKIFIFQACRGSKEDFGIIGKFIGQAKCILFVFLIKNLINCPFRKCQGSNTVRSHGI